MFKDITPLLLDPGRFRRALELMRRPVRRSKVQRVVSIESRGFLLGAPIALLLERTRAIRSRGNSQRREVEWSTRWIRHRRTGMHRDAWARVTGR